MKHKLPKKPWWDYLEEDLRELLLESFLLSERVGEWNEKFHDYAFVVFPAAKAYEGFLKKFFLDLKLISTEDYFGKHFRVGKALNPQLEKKYRDDSVYDMLKDYCGSDELPSKLWDAWKRCRNILFHWFPNERNVVTLEEARERITIVVEAIDAAFKECVYDQQNK